MENIFAYLKTLEYGGHKGVVCHLVEPAGLTTNNIREQRQGLKPVGPASLDVLHNTVHQVLQHTS